MSITRLGVITDTHGNLPALRTALKLLQDQSCDAIVHLGDTVGIGPYPAECVELLLATPSLIGIRGNHDAWAIDGLPDTAPQWMSREELEHHRWVHDQLSNEHRAAMARWVPAWYESIGSRSIVAVHYAFDPRRQFARIVHHPTAFDLNVLFMDLPGDLVLYGHHHPASDIQSSVRRYLNPGSLGCSLQPYARVAIVTEDDITLHKARYDPTELLQAFDDRTVPERDLLRASFMPQKAIR